MESRIGAISIIIEEPDSVEALNNVLHEYASCILGRMGIPYREKGVNIICIAIIILAVVIAVVLIAALAGCSSAQADLSSVLNDINTNHADATEGLKQLTDVSDLDAYYSISADDVKQFAAEIKTDTSQAPVEIVLVEAAGSDSVENVRTALERRLQSIISLYTSYSPEELDLVKDCEVTVSGNYVTMVVAEDYDGIMEIVNKAVK